MEFLFQDLKRQRYKKKRKIRTIENPSTDNPGFFVHWFCFYIFFFCFFVKRCLICNFFCSFSHWIR